MPFIHRLNKQPSRIEKSLNAFRHPTKSHRRRVDVARRCTRLRDFRGAVCVLCCALLCENGCVRTEPSRASCRCALLTQRQPHQTPNSPPLKLNASDTTSHYFFKCPSNQALKSVCEPRTAVSQSRSVAVKSRNAGGIGDRIRSHHTRQHLAESTFLREERNEFAWWQRCVRRE